MRKYSQNLTISIGDRQEERRKRDSEERDDAGAQLVPDGAMEADHSIVPGKRAKQQSILSAARDLGKNILLLAAKTADSGGGAGDATDHRAGAWVDKQTKMLYIRYRSAELTLPAETDIEAIAAVLRSLQQL